MSRNYGFMEQSFKGTFWLPEKEDQQVQGVLDFNGIESITLNLSGVLIPESFREKATSHKQVSVIVGRSENGKIINLYNCYTFTKNLTPSIESQNFFIEFLILGNQGTPNLEYTNSYNFTRIDFRFSGNTFWVGSARLFFPNEDVSEKFFVDYNSRSYENIAKLNGFNISIKDQSSKSIFLAIISLVDGKRLVDYEVQEKYLSLSSDEPRNIDEFVQAAILFKSFLVFCMNQGISFTKSNIHSQEEVTKYKTPHDPLNEEIPEDVIDEVVDLGYAKFTSTKSNYAQEYTVEEEIIRSLYFSISDIYQQKEDIDRNIFTLNFSQIKENFSEVIYNWEQCMSGDLKVVILKFLKTMSLRNMSYDDIILEQAKALEAFHKIEYHPDQGPSFKSRINELIDKHNEYYPASYLDTNDKKVNFIKELKDQRNAFTHPGGDTLNILNSVDNRSAVYLIKTSRLLLLICLLVKLGVRSNVVKEVANHKWLRGF